MRIRFLTSTPLDIRRGSGTYVGMQVLARALESLGHTVAFETPRLRTPIYTLDRLLFNARLRAAAGSISRWASTWMATASPPHPGTWPRSRA